MLRRTCCFLSSSFSHQGGVGGVGGVGTTSTKTTTAVSGKSLTSLSAASDLLKSCSSTLFSNKKNNNSRSTNANKKDVKSTQLTAASKNNISNNTSTKPPSPMSSLKSATSSFSIPPSGAMAAANPNDNSHNSSSNLEKKSSASASSKSKTKKISHQLHEQQSPEQQEGRRSPVVVASSPNKTAQHQQLHPRTVDEVISLWETMPGTRLSYSTSKKLAFPPASSAVREDKKSIRSDLDANSETSNNFYSVAQDAVNLMWHLISRNRAPRPRILASASSSNISSSSLATSAAVETSGAPSLSSPPSIKQIEQEKSEIEALDEDEEENRDSTKNATASSLSRTNEHQEKQQQIQIQQQQGSGGESAAHVAVEQMDNAQEATVQSTNRNRQQQQQERLFFLQQQQQQRQQRRHTSAIASLMTLPNSRRHSCCCDTNNNNDQPSELQSSSSPSSSSSSAAAAAMTRHLEQALFAYDYLLPFSLKLNSPLDHSRLLVSSAIALLEGHLFCPWVLNQSTSGASYDSNVSRSSNSPPLSTAVDRLQEAIDVASTLGANNMTVHWRCLLAVCLVARGDYFRADDALTDATEMARLLASSATAATSSSTVGWQFGCEGPGSMERVVEALPGLLQNSLRLEWAFVLKISVPSSPSPQTQMGRLEKQIFRQLGVIRSLSSVAAAATSRNVDQLKIHQTILAGLLLQSITLTRAYARETVFSSTFIPVLMTNKNKNQNYNDADRENSTTTSTTTTATTTPVGVVGNPILYKPLLHILDAIESTTSSTSGANGLCCWASTPLDGVLVALRHEAVRYLVQITRLDLNDGAARDLRRHTTAAVTSMCTFLKSRTTTKKTKTTNTQNSHRTSTIALGAALAPEFIRLILTCAFLTLEIETQSPFSSFNLQQLQQRQNSQHSQASSVPAPTPTSKALAQYAYAFRLARKYKIPAGALDRSSLEYATALCRAGRIEIAARIISEVTRRMTMIDRSIKRQRDQFRTNDESGVVENDEKRKQEKQKQTQQQHHRHYHCHQVCRLGESTLPLRWCELYLVCGAFLQSLGNSHTNNSAAELMFRLAAESAKMTAAVEAECVRAATSARRETMTMLMNSDHVSSSNNNNNNNNNKNNGNETDEEVEGETILVRDDDDDATSANRNYSAPSQRGGSHSTKELAGKYNPPLAYEQQRANSNDRHSNNNNNHNNHISNNNSSPKTLLLPSPASSSASFATQSSTITTKTLGKALESLGYLLLLQGRSHEAHAYFRKVLRLMLKAPHAFPPNCAVQTRFRYALALESANQPMRARRVYDKLLSSSTTLALSTGEKLSMTLRSALLHHYTLGEYTEAAALYFVSLALDSENPHNMVQLAWCMLQISDQPDIGHIRKYYDAALLVLHCCEVVSTAKVELKPAEMPVPASSPSSSSPSSVVPGESSKFTSQHGTTKRLSAAMQCTGPWDTCYVLGECAVFYHDHIGDLETAKALYEQALSSASAEQSENYAQVAANFAVLLCYDLKDTVAAETWFDVAVKHPKPHNEAALVHLFSEFLIQTGKIGRAAEELGRVAHKYGLSDTWHRLAKVEERLHRNNSYGYALSCYSRALGASLIPPPSTTTTTETIAAANEQHHLQQQQQHQGLCAGQRTEREQDSQSSTPAAAVTTNSPPALLTPSDEGLKQLFQTNVHDDMTLPIASDLLLLLHHKYGAKKLALIDSLYRILCRAFPHDVFLLVNYARFLNDIAFKPHAALRKFRQALQIDRTNVALLDNLAEHLTQVYPDRLDLAERCHLESIRENPHDPQAHFAYACFLSYYYPANELAEQHFHRALELDRSDTVSLCSYAAFLEAMIENNGPAWEARTDATHYAEEMYREAIRLSPHTASHYLQLACFLWRSGRLSEAWSAFETCLELDRANVNALRLAGTFLQDWLVTHGGKSSSSSSSSTNSSSSSNTTSGSHSSASDDSKSFSPGKGNAGGGKSKSDFLRGLRGGKDQPKNPVTEALANLAEGLFKRAFELDPRDISVLKSFASFLDEVRRDTRTSQELMSVATQLEMEQLMARRRVLEKEEQDKNEHEDQEDDEKDDVLDADDANDDEEEDDGEGDTSHKTDPAAPSTTNRGPNDDGDDDDDDDDDE